MLFTQVIILFILKSVELFTVIILNYKIWEKQAPGYKDSIYFSWISCYLYSITMNDYYLCFNAVIW